jgi:ribose transport system substrate-binding protein
MRSRTILGCLVACAALAAMVVAILPGGAAGSAKKPYVIAVAGQVGIPFYTSIQCGAQDAAKKYGITFKWTGSTDWNITTEMPFITAAMRLKPDAIIFTPVDSTALVPTTLQMKKQGIYPITWDAPLAKPVDVANFQSNHYAGGVAAANAMIKLTGGKGTYLDVDLKPGLPDIGARTRGFVDTMKKRGAKVLPILYPGTDSSKAAQQISAAIRAHPDLTGIYVTHSAAAQGASAALKQAGKQGKIKLIAFDADPQQIVDLKRGVYDALVVQEPYQMGYQAVKLAGQLARGQVKASQVKEEHLLPFFVVTRKNVNNPKVKQYFYKASC